MSTKLFTWNFLDSLGAEVNPFLQEIRRKGTKFCGYTHTVRFSLATLSSSEEQETIR
jgi:hypothetical protein